MADALQILAPLLSVNEPESQVVEVLVRPGQQISPGELLCVLATTKANFDVEAETSGYIHSVSIARGQTVAAGMVIFEIGPEPPVSIEAAQSKVLDQPRHGVRITDKAQKLARDLDVDLAGLPRDVLVTEAMVRTLAGEQARVAPKLAGLPNEVLLYGGGGHAKTIIDLLRQTRDFQIAGIVADPVPKDSNVLGVPVLGPGELLASLYDRGLRLIVNAVGGIERPRVRAEIFERLAKLGYQFPVIVHRTAVVEPSASIAAGAQIFAMAFIGSAAVLGAGAIVNTGAIVSHDCVLGDYAQLTPGVLLAGHVKVGVGALVGMGVTTQVNVSIGEWARIGNGARIHGDVPPHTIVPAGTVWP